MAFLKGRDLALDDSQLTKLRLLLNIVPGDAGIPDCAGPYVLAPKCMKAAVEAYDYVTGGGDIDFAFEAIPPRGPVIRAPGESPALLNGTLLVVRPYGGYTSFFVLPQRQRNDYLSDRELGRFINAVKLTIVSRAYYDWTQRVQQILTLQCLKRNDQIYRLNFDYDVLFDQLQIVYEEHATDLE